MRECARSSDRRPSTLTRTSLWIEPEQSLFVILLTNRVHPSRDNWKIREVRSAFHDAVMEALATAPRPRGR